MTDIRPTNPDHSVVEVIFALQFAADLNEHQLRSIATLDLPDLPNKKEAAAVQFRVQDGKVISSGDDHHLAEVQFSHHKSDGRPDWVLKVAPRYVAVSCLDYDQWERVWPKAEALLRLIAPKVIGDKTPMSGIGLQYIDRFVYEGDEGHYAATDLFIPDSPYLTKKTLGAGALWHVHQGWFDSAGSRLDQSCQILNRLNVNASKDVEEHQTIVDHQLVFLFSTPISHPAMFAEGEEGEFTQIMDLMHTANKDVLRDLLTRTMLDQIGMG